MWAAISIGLFKTFHLSVFILVVSCSGNPSITPESLYGKWEGRETGGDIVAFLEIKERTMIIQNTGEFSGTSENGYTVRNENGNLLMTIDGTKEVLIVSVQSDGQMYFGPNSEDRSKPDVPHLSTLSFTKIESGDGA